MNYETWAQHSSGHESREELETKKRQFIRSHAEAIFLTVEHNVAGVKVPNAYLAQRFADKILMLVPEGEIMDTSLQPQIFRDMAADLHDVLVGGDAFQNIPNREKILKLIEEIQDLSSFRRSPPSETIK